jgi:uncharacterized protein YkwD
MGEVYSLGKRFLVSLLVFSFLLSFSTGIEANASQQVKVFINGNQQIFDQSPVIHGGRTYVPLRGVFETLGAQVTWNSKTKTIEAIQDRKRIQLTIGSSLAYIDGNRRSLDAPAFIQGGRTLVPLRFISESLGADVEWNSVNKTIQVYSGQHTKIPVVPLPKTDVESSGFIGKSEASILQEFGQPKHKTISEYGFEWNIFHNNYHDYVLIGIQNGKVVALYTNSARYLKRFDLTLNTTKSSVRQRLGTPIMEILKNNMRYTGYNDKEWDLFETKQGYLTVFYDIHEGSTVTSIQIMEKVTEYRKLGYYGKASIELRNAFERHSFDLANAIRVRKGLAALIWDDRISITARKHSEDMAKYNYFAHNNLSKQTPFDRMKHDGISYSTAGENLAMGQFSAIFAHEGLMNSMGHRRALLNSEFTMLGTGVAFQRNTPYITQKFFTPK